MSTGRFIVCGGRDYHASEVVRLVLRSIDLDMVLVHGAAPGADSLAARMWEDMGGVTEPHPADWAGPCRDSCRPNCRRDRRDGTDYCSVAGPWRNQQMANLGADFLAHFPGHAGTSDMIKRAGSAGIRVRSWYEFSSAPTRRGVNGEVIRSHVRPRPAASVDSVDDSDAGVDHVVGVP